MCLTSYNMNNQLLVPRFPQFRETGARIVSIWEGFARTAGAWFFLFLFYGKMQQSNGIGRALSAEREATIGRENSDSRPGAVRAGCG